ncbi:MAG: hypothetical protein RLZZ444_2743, partial [Pseudomonadota bacterium]
MHLLLAQKGSLSDSEEASDLGQSPGEVIFLSAADTEIASVAAAAVAGRHSWRLVNLASLKHPMSIDLWIDKTARHSRLVVLRALGGYGYFTYLIEALMGASQRYGFQFVALAGDDRPDKGLDAWTTLSPDDGTALWSYLVEAGPDNAGRFVAYAEALVDGGEKPAPASKLDKAGIWWPDRGVIGEEDWIGLRGETKRPLAVITFYRALIQSGQTEAVEAL